jgi:hypothetical protein
MEAAARMRLAALAVLLAVLVPLVVIAVSSGGGADGAPAGLQVERTPGVPEVIVYVEDPEVNRTDTAGGAVRVTLQCLDRDGEVVWRSREEWPFTDTDRGTLDPHVHLAMAATVVDRVARCRLKDTDPPLEGRLI